MAKRHLHDLVRSLAALGDAIAARIRTLGTNQCLITKWEQREANVTDDQALAMSLGLPIDETLDLLQQQAICRPSCRHALLHGMDELRAAARMLGSCVDIEDLAVILASITGVGSRETPELDVLT